MSPSAAAILDVLDEQWALDWPDFRNISSTEYHAMRLVVLRDAADWGLVFDQVVGTWIDESAVMSAGVRSKIYGPSVPPHDINVPAKRSIGLHTSAHERDDLALDGVVVMGPAGELRFEPHLVEALDLRPGAIANWDRWSESPADVVLLRAYLARFPGSLFGSLAESAAMLGGTERDVLLVSDAFEHVVSRLDAEDEPDRRYARRPSESAVFRSLAEAIAANDASHFRPGTPNLDWRTWATFQDERVASGTR